MGKGERAMRRTKGQGSLIKLRNSPFWHARFYDAMGRKISMTTGTKVKAIAEEFLRKQLHDVRDNPLAPLGDVRKITDLQRLARRVAGQLRRTEPGNKSLKPRADGEETVNGLPQLDAFFKFSADNPGPSVVQIGTDTARKFVEERQAEGAGNAVIRIRA